MCGVGGGGDVVDGGVRGRGAVCGVVDAGLWAGTGRPGREVVVCRGEHRHVGIIGGVNGLLTALLLHQGVEHRAGDHRRWVFHGQRGAWGEEGMGENVLGLPWWNIF